VTKVAILGAGGYVGSGLVQRAAKSHAVDELLVVDAFPRDCSWLRCLNSGESIEVRQEYLHPNSDLTFLTECDYVVNAIGLVGEPACTEDPASAEILNATLPKSINNFLDAVGSARLIHLSTCSTYETTPKGLVATEDWAVSPKGIYASSKVRGEDALRENEKTVVLRMGTICGVTPQTRLDLMATEIAWCVHNGRDFSLLYDDAFRPFLHIDDLWDILFRIFQLGEEFEGGLYNAISENIQKGVLAHQVKKEFPKFTFSSITAPSRKIATDNRDYQVSNQKLVTGLDVSPRKTTVMAIKEVVREMQVGLLQAFVWNESGATAVKSSEFQVDSSTNPYSPSLKLQ